MALATTAVPVIDDHRSDRLSECIIYEVSPRGGNNFWMRFLNGCDKIAQPGYGTLGLRVAPNGRFVLIYDPEIVAKWSARQLKLALIHEAGHGALRHHERLFRILSTITEKDLRLAVMAIFNIAADLADNDAIVKHEKEFPDALKSEEWTWLTPELYGLPSGLSFEDYVVQIAKKAKPIAKKLMEAAEKQEQREKEQQQKQQGKKSQPNQGKQAGGQAGSKDEGDEGGEESGGVPGGADVDFGSGDDEDDTSSTPSKGMGGGATKQRGPESFSDDPEDSISDNMQDLAKNQPQLLKDMLAAFNKLMHNNHKDWQDMAEGLDGDSARSLADKMKKHSRQLAKAAYEQTMKSRGTVPGYIKGLVAPLLKDEQIPWHWFFQDCIQASITSKIIEAMASPNVSFINLDHIEPWPGQALDMEFSVVWITDTSGSMGDGEFARARAVLNQMMNVDRSIKLRDIQVDTHIQHEEEKENAESLDIGNERFGYGGTTLAAAFRRAMGVDTQSDWVPDAWESKCEEPPRTVDLIVCYTDGYTEPMTEPIHHPGCAVIWLITPDGTVAEGMSDVPPEHVIKMFRIVPD